MEPFLVFFLQFLIFSNFLTSLNYSDNQRKDLSFFMLRKLNTKWSLLTHVLLLQTTVKVKSIVEGVTFSSRHKIKTHQLSLSSASITPHSNSSLLKKSFNKKKKSVLTLNKILNMCLRYMLRHKNSGQHTIIVQKRASILTVNSETGLRNPVWTLMPFIEGCCLLFPERHNWPFLSLLHYPQCSAD